MIEAARGFGRSGLFLVAGLFVILFMWAATDKMYREIATRRIQFLTIKMIDTPRTCVSRRTRGIFGFFSSGRHRSSVPSQGSGTGLYCGYILTDYGSFLLPESNSWAFWNDSRETIADRIKVGCKYEATVAGYYNGFENRQPPINTIYKVGEGRGCRKAD